MKKILHHLVVVGIALVLSITHTPQGYAQSDDPLTTEACHNLLLNGDFESNSGWNLTSSDLPAQYSPLAYSGNQSLLIGLEQGRVIDDQAWSAARQTVTLPADKAATLSFWYRSEFDPQPGDDRFFVALLDEEDQVIETLLDEVLEPNQWNLFTREIPASDEGLIQVYFGVENDGLGGATRMLVDEVQLCTHDPTDQERSTEKIEAVATSTPAISPVDADNVVDFERLGTGPLTLESPFGGATLQFSLPATWEPTEGAELQLDLTTFVGSATSAAASAPLKSFRGSLEVRLNKVLLTTLSISQSDEQTIAIPIPLTALIPDRYDGQQELDFALRADVNCGTAEQMSVLVYPSSRLVIPHEIVAPSTDLRRLPQPIYQASFVPDTAVIVVPDQPTSAQMQAALSVAAGFGQMTRSRLSLTLLPINRLTPDVQEANHLIFVGKAADFPLLEEVTLPAPSNGSVFEVEGADTDDGIIQMAVSPWNESQVILVVGGTSDTAIVKAAQAVSSGLIRVGSQTNLALVADIHPNDFVSSPEIVDRTFTDLGYTVRQLKNQGTNYAEYYFNVPPGYIGDPEAYLDLIINHSALLDYDASGLVVRLNGVSIGSIRFTDDFTSPSRIHFNVPRSVLLPGKNELQIRAELEPVTDCVSPDVGGLWLTIWPESLLHLPLNPAPGEIKLNLQLHKYPNPFIQSPTLGNTAFILPPNNPIAWNVAAQIASDLGHESDAVLADLAVFYGNDIPAEIGQTRHLLLVGRPSELSVVETLKEIMPIAFETGSDLASERQMRVSYRLPPDTSLGYLQLFPSPWNKSQVILTILGSTDQGIQWAGHALLEPSLRSELENNLAVISGEQIINGEQQAPGNLQSQTGATTPPVVDTNESTAVSTLEEIAEEPVAADTEIGGGDSTPTPLIEGRPAWILPVLGGSLLLTLIIIIVAVVIGWRQRRLSSSIKH